MHTIHSGQVFPTSSMHLNTVIEQLDCDQQHKTDAGREPQQHRAGVADNRSFQNDTCE
jgi:hypothetical protein